MDAPLQIARNGEVIGTWTEAEVKKQIKQGCLCETDVYWREGMSEWKPLARLSEKRAGKRQRDFLERRGVALPDDVTHAEAEQMIVPWKEAEALAKENEKRERERQIQKRDAQRESERTRPTGKQVAFLQYHKATIKEGLTREEASELIQHIIDHAVEYPTPEDWNEVKYVLHPEIYGEPISARSNDWFQNSVDELEQRVRGLRQKLKQAEDKEQRDELEQELKELTDELAEAKQDLKDQKEEQREDERGRIQDWGNVFKGDLFDVFTIPVEQWDVVTELAEQYRKPTQAQIRHILSECDKTLKPKWESTHAASFFRCYERLYPIECRKLSYAASRKANPQGCLVLLIVGATLTMLCYFTIHYNLI